MIRAHPFDGGQDRPKRLSFAQLHGRRGEQTGRDVVQVGLAVHESVVVGDQVTYADAE